jgi:hypothetical protein
MYMENARYLSFLTAMLAGASAAPFWTRCRRIAPEDLTHRKQLGGAAAERWLNGGAACCRGRREMDRRRES